MSTKRHYVVEFTDEQKKVISHGKGILRIIACPGSGKTEVISQRIVTLIEDGTNPKNIVAFTFTEKAAEELKFRIRQILEERCPKRADFGDMFVGTIHSFCFQLLKELDPVYRSYDVLDDAMRVAFVSKAANYYQRIGLVRLERANNLPYYKTIIKFLESADVVMMEDIDPARLSDRRFADCYLAYRELLDEEKYFDFSSVIHTFVSVARKPQFILRLLRERVKHVVVDEYQDVDKIQDMLVEILAGGAESLCVVGDDDQNIYHWRGSDVSIIRDFAKHYSKKGKVTDLTLSTNFRSTGELIQTSRSLIEHNINRLGKDMRHSESLQRKYEMGDIMYHHFDTDTGEINFIIDKIGELRGTDFLDKRNRLFSLSYKDFGILVRTNADAARIIAGLDARGIPCIAYSGNSVFESREVLLAMNCIAYVFGCDSYPNYQSGSPTLPTLMQAYTAVFPSARFPSASRSRFGAKLVRIKMLIKRLVAKGEKDYFGELGLQGYYYRILNALGAEDLDFGDVVNYNLAVLSRAISDYESVWIRLRAREVKYFFTFVRAFAEGHYTETMHSDIAMIDAVQVLTIHKAKGLEYPVVFMPNFEERRKWPPSPTLVDPSLYDTAKYHGTEEDERRVYYTAMTRSEKYLFITGAAQHQSRRTNYSPHRFLQDIDMKFVTDAGPLNRSKSGQPPRIQTSGIYPTSFTQLTAYSRCPQDFKLRHIYQYNAGVPVTFGYGTNIHNALNVIHSNYIRRRFLKTRSE